MSIEKQENTILPEQKSEIPEYVSRSHEIRDIEFKHYLQQRRAKNELIAPTAETLTGLCISGGGVRSATLGLGMLQAFIQKGMLKKFDYLSTVSGGGYIGSCLTSLMSSEPFNSQKFESDKSEKLPNLRFSAAKQGMNMDDCSLIDQPDNYEYTSIEHTELSGKHQLRHLRRHGEYLTPHTNFTSWDVSRAVGALFSGMFINMLLYLLFISFLVLFHHALFFRLSKGNFIEDLRKASGVQSHSNLNYFDQFVLWFWEGPMTQLKLVGNALLTHNPIAFAFLVFGICLSSFFIWWSLKRAHQIAAIEEAEAGFSKTTEGKIKAGKFFERPGGEDVSWYGTKKLAGGFLLISWVLGPVLAYFTSVALHYFGDEEPAYMMLGLPFIYNIGLAIPVFFFIPLYLINNYKERVSGRIYRAFYNGLQGISFLGLLISAIFPLMIILVFGGTGFGRSLFFSFLPVAGAYFFTFQLVGGKSGSTAASNLLKKLQMPMLNLSILLFLGMSIASLSSMFYGIEKYIYEHYQYSLCLSAIFLFVFVTIFLVIGGFAANANDLSLHYFYRDRLTEAYLRTNGRVSSDENNTKTDKGLSEITLRNHENLRLFEMGEGELKAPYHILVGALNLQGSYDLAQKTLKSDHFIFSKFFLGSRTTGYYNSMKYRQGSFKLNTAMTISAAALATGMGSLSFAASNFYMTLFNLRTGYWVENPRFLYNQMLENAKEKVQAPWLIRPFKRFHLYMWQHFPFWLVYLGRELVGNLTTDTRRVYVSDGGYTGDNLGLMPLLQRRCKTIVVADFEEDGKFSFGSFTTAIRLAKSIYNIDIKIDLEDLIPQKDAFGHLISKSSVAEGRIHYPKDKNSEAFVGKIIYQKSSVALLSPEPEGIDLSKKSEKIPVYVLNYFKSNPVFPHQPTADQYFDEVQFEAYRMLGEHIGHLAAGKIRVGDLPEDLDIEMGVPT